MINLYNGYEAKKTSFASLDVGGYVLRVLNAEVVKKPTTEWLVISFDISEGEQKDFYTKKYKENTNEDKKWQGTYWLRIPDEKNEYFARQKVDFENVMACFEESNNGYRFNGDETALKGKIIGGVFGKEEWMKNSGETAWSVKCRYLTDVNSIRNNDFRIPKDKPLANKATQNNNASTPDLNKYYEEFSSAVELPFN